MKCLVTAVFLCLAGSAFASVVAPYFHGALPYAPLAAVPAVPHYAALPVGRAVAYGSHINHGTVVGYGLAPYGYKYGLPAAPLPVKYGVPAAPLHVKYGVPAPHLLHAPLGYSLGLHKAVVL